MLLCLHFKDMIRVTVLFSPGSTSVLSGSEFWTDVFIKPAFFSRACKNQFWNVKKALSWLVRVRKVLVSILSIQIVEASQSSNGWLPVRLLLSFRNTISPFKKYLLTYLVAPGVGGSMWDLAPWARIKPGPTASGAESLSRWTMKEALSLLDSFCYKAQVLRASAVAQWWRISPPWQETQEIQVEIQENPLE